jgi:hypothetical protein
VVAAVTVVVVLAASVAIADVFLADGDGLEPIGANALNLGDVCLDSTAKDTALLAIVRSGPYDREAFLAGSTVRMSVAVVLNGAGGGLTVVLDGDTTTVPSGWATWPAGSNTPPVEAKVKLAAGSSPGSYSATIAFRADGTNAVGQSISRFVSMPVRAEIVECATNRPPRLHLPNDRTVEGNVRGGAMVEFDAWAEDDEDGPLEPACSPASGTKFGLGTTTVSCSVADSAGEEAHGSFDVTVVDTTPPSFAAVPDDVQVTASGVDGAIVRYDEPKANDVVDPDPSVGCSPEPGSWFAPGSTTVTCTATDASGNAASVSFTVTVLFDFQGFMAPASGTGRATVQGGSVVPLRWRVGGGGSGPITDAGVMNMAASGVQECGAWGPTGNLLDHAPGATRPRVVGGSFLFDWQTPAGPGCYQVTIVLTDGVPHVARFQVR